MGEYIKKKINYKIICGNCSEELNSKNLVNIDLTFLDPPFNQDKEYTNHNDNLPEEVYWNWMRGICSNIYNLTTQGGAIYFMQREKNTEHVLTCLKETGWTFQNLIIWKKKASAVPCRIRFSKQYQIIAFATKGEKPRVFNRLRIDLPVPPEYKYERTNGVYLSDVWDDIRELTSGYFAGDEAIRDINGNRIHTQQAPVALLLRIILSSTLPGGNVLDPFAGSGTTLAVAYQLGRNTTGIEINPELINIIEDRLKHIRTSDNILQYYNYYRYTQNLEKIWQAEKPAICKQRSFLNE
ncbi:MAG: site-specific DNA-methyltransferase [Candidatus Brocadiales bacterium]|nr:site-specific DNA-methyltransferase [Candidatus Brocadiales bacterium]